MRKVLVLGANGYIGSNICTALKVFGHYVIGVGRSKPVCIDVDEYLQLNLSLRDSIEALSAIDYDTVIDLVSFVLPNDRSIRMDEVNGVLNTYTELIKYCFSDKLYIFVSSGGTVYGSVSYPCVEEQSLSPLTPYALQKVYQEEIIQRYVKQHVILRVSNPYGGNQKVKNGVGFVAGVVSSIKNNIPITLTVPGCTTRDYVQIDDVKRATLFFVNNFSQNIVVNVSSGFGVTLDEVVIYYAKKMGKSLVINNVFNGEFLPSHIHYNVLNNEKLVSLILMKPRGLFNAETTNVGSSKLAKGF